MWKNSIIAILVLFSLTAVSADFCLAAPKCKEEKQAVKFANKAVKKAERAVNKQLNKIDRMGNRLENQEFKLAKLITNADATIQKMIFQCDTQIARLESRRVELIARSVQVAATCFLKANPQACYNQANNLLNRALQLEFVQIPNKINSCNNKINSKIAQFNSKISFQTLKVERFEDDLYDLIVALPPLEATLTNAEAQLAIEQAELLQCLAGS